MYDLELRQNVVQLLQPWLGCKDNVKDSLLLRAYVTVKMMHATGIVAPEKAYEQLRKYTSSFAIATLKPSRFPVTDEMQVLYRELASISLIDYLTFVVPESICDPCRTVSLLEQNLPEKNIVEWVYHIIQIRKLGILVGSLKSAAEGKTVSLRDQIYAVYCGFEKCLPLSKDLLLMLYSAINTFELQLKELKPNAIGFTVSDIEKLMDILTDELQMTREKQIELVARFFVRKEQAVQITEDETLYNFVSCKKRKERIKKVNQALRLIAKIPPLELLCAISTRKKVSGVSVTKKTEGKLLANDVTLENGFVHPLIMNNFGYEENAAILLMYPSMHFVRKLFCDKSMRYRNVTVVLQDRNAVDLLRYQREQKAFDEAGVPASSALRFEESGRRTV